jgi:hypothetical protein
MITPVIISAYDDRKVQIEKEMNYCGIKDYYIHNTKVILEDKIKAVSQAHKDGLHMAMMLNITSPYVVMMEDDVCFTHPRAYHYFMESVENLPGDWDIYLGGFTGGFLLQPDFKNIYRMGETSGFHLYAVSKKFYSKFLSANENIHIDIWCTSPNYGAAKTFSCYPVAAIQHLHDRQNQLNIFFNRQKRYNGTKSN